MGISIFTDRDLSSDQKAVCPRLEGFCRYLGRGHKLTLFTRQQGNKPDGVADVVILPPLPSEPESRWSHSLLQFPSLLTKYRYPSYTRQMESLIGSAVQKSDYNLFMDLTVAQYIPKITNARIVIDLVDAPSRVAISFLKQSNGLRSRLGYLFEYLHLRQVEKALSRFPLIVISEHDARALQHTLSRVITVPNGVYEASETTKPEEQVSRIIGRNPRIGFLGVMNYPPNVDAMIWFTTEVFPSIRLKFPSAELRIIGQNPDKRILRMAMDNTVTVTGYVEDPFKELVQCDLFVSPLRYGTGIKNKLLQALSVGLPTVASSVTIESTGLLPHVHLLEANSGLEFVREIERLISDRDLRVKLSVSGRKFVRDNFCWPVISQKLESIILSS